MARDAGHRGISRRRFLRDSAVAGAAAAVLGPAAAGADGHAPSLRARRVAVLGGGVAGLTAAHELAERGFSVDVYERKSLGGKSRSIPVPGTAVGARHELPGEHGFRFFPGFYHHVPDTMRRIPFSGNPNGVHDNLVAANVASFARSGGREDLMLGVVNPLTVDSLRRALIAGYEELTTLPPDELAFFVRQLLVYFTSSDERRFGQWEYVSWWDFIRAERMSDEYKQMLAIGITRNLIAARADLASTRTVGAMVEAFIYSIMGRGNDGAPDRVLNGPTNEAWIDPWVALLQRLGVRFHVGYRVEALEPRGGQIASTVVRDAAGTVAAVEADWFVCALPVERARALWSPAILAADPRLEGTFRLRTEWMNGIQFYLRRPVPVIRGHLSYVDSPWALTSISQAQFWEGRQVARDYGDGTVRDILSVDISNWDEPGMIYGRPASRCAPHEIAAEVWAQIKAHIEDTGKTYLPDRVLHSWFLDPAITYPSPGTAANDEPLLVNTIGSWDHRPEPTTAIPNLFLAADYVRDNIDLATMEGANETARAAVNALLEASGSRAAPARKYTLYRPPEFGALKRADAALYRRGRPNALDTPWPGS